MTEDFDAADTDSEATVTGMPATIAYRGSAGAYSENTAFAGERAGVHESVVMVEVDVIPAADETVVCFHDDHSHRTETRRDDDMHQRHEIDGPC